MDQPSNVAKDLWDALKLCEVHPRVVLLRVFHISPVKFFQYVTGKKQFPEEWEEDCKKLTKLFQDAYDKKILPKARDELVWYGLNYLL